MASDDDTLDVRAKTPLDRLAAWLGPPRGYALTRWLILRLLAFVYVFAFVGLLVQGLPLLGAHGLTPAQQYVDWLHGQGETFWDTPSLFMLDASDTALVGWAIAGLVLSLCVLVGYANLPILLAVWFIYGSYERVGQLWWGFGWEIQILETTLLAAFLVHPYDPRPLRAPQPPAIAIVLMRWLVFRIMLGAGLIKWRGDPCWRELTCLDAHFETQPIPNPASAAFHQLPHVVLAAGVAFNHLVELVMPWCVFGPRIVRLVAGCAMAAFQMVLIVSGNLAFLNWLTLVPVLACFDDEFLLIFVPRRTRAWLHTRMPEPQPRSLAQLAIAFGGGLVVIAIWGPVFGWLAAGTEVLLALALGAGAIGGLVLARRHFTRVGIRLDGHQLALGALAALVALKSCAVVDNLFFAKRQAMNRDYDRLSLVNTYGAFGSVGMERHELVIEGTLAIDPTSATWSAYELPCKPGDLARRPCILGPFHRRLDWLIWFAAMDDELSKPWVIHLVWKLLDGDRGIRTLLAVDPFDGKPPNWIRIRRFIYHLQPLGADTWWTRDHEELWLPPVSLTSPGFTDALARYGWPSPTDR
jgi:hypothetical protein